MHVELFNLRADLSEKNDLSAKVPAKTEGLRGMLHASRQAVWAQMPVRK